MGAVNPADAVIEEAAKVMADRQGWKVDAEHLRDARALHAAGLLADPADRDENCLHTRMTLAELDGWYCDDCGVKAPTWIKRITDSAEAEIAELRATVARVREVHQPHACTGFPDCAYVFGGQCAYEGDCDQCRTPYPCATIRALGGVGEQP